MIKNLQSNYARWKCFKHLSKPSSQRFAPCRGRERKENWALSISVCGRNKRSAVKDQITRQAQAWGPGDKLDIFPCFTNIENTTKLDFHPFFPGWKNHLISSRLLTGGGFTGSLPIYGAGLGGGQAGVYINQSLSFLRALFCLSLWREAPGLKSCSYAARKRKLRD